MIDGDRALDAWLALKLGWEGYTENRDIMWWCKDGKWLIHNPPHYTGRDCLQLAEALQGEPHGACVCIAFRPAVGSRPAYCSAQIIGDGVSMPYFSQEDADTPGLALGRAAEQALGGDS